MTISRADDFGGRYRGLVVYVDEVIVGKLRPRQTMTLELPDGPHSVRGRMDWATCQPFVLHVARDLPLHLELSLSLFNVWKSFVRPRQAVVAQLLGDVAPAGRRLGPPPSPG